DLPLVLGAIDRTTTATGAQVMWRWLAAPAVRAEVVHARERKLARLTDRALRGEIASALRGGAAADAPPLPRLLGEPAARPPCATLAIAIACALAACALAARWWPVLWLAVAALVIAAVLIDDWSRMGLAHQARALEVLGQTLGAAAHLVTRVPPELV